MRPLPPIPRWVALEHEVVKYLPLKKYMDGVLMQRLHGNLHRLSKELEQTSELLRNRHPFVFGSEFTPKRNNKTSGYIEGCTFTKLKELNPTSRDHISWILQTFHGWKC